MCVYALCGCLVPVEIRRVTPTMWMLGIEPESFARAASNLNLSSLHSNAYINVFITPILCYVRKTQSFHSLPTVE